MRSKPLKRMLAISLAVTMLTPVSVLQSADFSSLIVSAAGVTQAVIVENGICGETATYTLDDQGTLTILGSGAVGESAFAGGVYANAPDVLNIVFAPGSTIQEIGAGAFSGLENLQTVGDVMDYIKDQGIDIE